MSGSIKGHKVKQESSCWSRGKNWNQWRVTLTGHSCTRRLWWPQTALRLPVPSLHLGACVSVPASPRASGACVRAVCPGLTGIDANPPPCVRSLLQLVISGPVPQSPHAALPPGFYPHIHTPPLGYGAVPAHPAAHPALPTHPGHTFLSGMGFPFRPIR